MPWSEWLPAWPLSHRVQLVAAAGVSGALVASGIFSYQTLRRTRNTEWLKSSIPELTEEHKTIRVRTYHVDFANKFYKISLFLES